MKDPRPFQIIFLSSLLLLGLFRLEFRLELAQVVLTFAAGLCAQGYFLNRFRLKDGYLSALVTCLGICLLVRSDVIWVHPLAAAVGVGGKFLLRARGKHLFNPANLGVVFVLLAGRAWVSPAQWGHEAMIAAWVLLIGATVVWRARRSDVSVAFLGFFLALCALRVFWLGQRWAVLEHRLDDGSLLIFTFFMISDPRTIPDSRRGRVALAGLVALFSFVWQFGFYRLNGLFYALFLLTPTTVLWDLLWPGDKYEWTPEKNHEDQLAPGRAAPLPA